MRTLKRMILYACVEQQVLNKEIENNFTVQLCFRSQLKMDSSEHWNINCMSYFNDGIFK